MTDDHFYKGRYIVDNKNQILVTYKVWDPQGYVFKVSPTAIIARQYGARYYELWTCVGQGNGDRWVENNHKCVATNIRTLTAAKMACILFNKETK
jgi:hypothetical protein